MSENKFPYPEIIKWLKGKGIEHFSIYPAGLDYFSIVFFVDYVPENVIEEFKEFVKRTLKAKVQDVYTIGKHYVDVIVGKDYTIEPKPTEIDKKRLLEIYLGKKGMEIVPPFDLKGYRKYKVIVTYGGKHRVIEDHIFIKKGRKYIHIVIPLPCGFRYAKIPFQVRK